MDRAETTAQLVRDAFPLRYVSVKPHANAGSTLVWMRRGRGPWRLYTATEALARKREWRMETMRKRRREKRHVAKVACHAGNC